MRKGRQGLGIAEMLIGVLIVMLAVALGFGAGRSARGQMSVRSVAVQLLADLRWARQWAAKHGLPAGVLIPSGAGAYQTHAVIAADPHAP